MKIVKEKNKIAKYLNDIFRISAGMERLVFFIMLFIVLCHIVCCLW